MAMLNNQRVNHNDVHNSPTEEKQAIWGCLKARMAFSICVVKLKQLAT